ncbi:DUF3865 domain-containing protein [Streptomyces scopuliridis]|uniref:DUF3865 domain-containing protein n=1 Tax=Streptomyces scopuliridis TaxID=452529 RepID=A0ACD4ZT68_9ACTN|nr:DUF3865 domain-containing protein [Streptomyces scopuliridis]WSC01665.1 DUF3865 domain-containing protein [Streptomyces scopuliridis]WSC04796.1 DUF3865 domain-containing protein [Streptomyces scopuliridis]
MTPDNSLIHAYLKTNPETQSAVHGTLLGRFTSGNALVTAHLSPMIDWVYGKIADQVGAAELTVEQARMYIEELSVFARYNAQYLKAAATGVEGFCPELAHELRRNHLEEGGERGKVPAHYVLYTNALLSDLGLLVNGHVPAPETETLVDLHQWMVGSHMPSHIAGAYYATEAVAIAETEILRDITNRYGDLTIQRSGSELKALHYYYELHLDDEHEAAQVGGLSVEAAHIEGLARFIKESELFHIDLPQALDGFLTIAEGMTHWWAQLAHRAREMN